MRLALQNRIKILRECYYWRFNSEAQNRMKETKATAENKYTIEWIDPTEEKDIGFVYLHGLWESSNSFEYQFAHAKKLNANFISLTLKGNGLRWPEAASTSSIDWLLEAGAAIERLAK